MSARQTVVGDPSGDSFEGGSVKRGRLLFGLCAGIVIELLNSRRSLRALLRAKVSDDAPQDDAADKNRNGDAHVRKTVATPNDPKLTCAPQDGAQTETDGQRRVRCSAWLGVSW